MTTRLTTHRPRMLMLSHCVPDAWGGVERARAWQLLRLVSQSHRVSLACYIDAPVNLSQWRAVRSRVDKLDLRNRPLVPRVRARIRRVCRLDPGPALRPDRTMGLPLRRGFEIDRFDAVLCTHPLFWSCVEPSHTSWRICDLNSVVCEAFAGSRLEPITQAPLAQRPKRGYQRGGAADRRQV